MSDSRVTVSLFGYPMHSGVLNTGVMLFHYGNGGLMRLLVTLSSLRRFYDGPVLVMLKTKDECWNYAGHIAKYASVQPFSLETGGKYAFANLKPYLLKHTPFDATLMLDGDLVIRKPIDILIDSVLGRNLAALPGGMVMTQLGKKIVRNDPCTMKRMETYLPFMDEATKHTLHDIDVPVVNIGVLGYRKDCAWILDEWLDLMSHNIGGFMNDETTANILTARHGMTVMPNTWNKSIDPWFDADSNDNAVILHYHGKRHTKHDVCDTGPWWRHLDSMIDAEFPADQIKSFLEMDESLQKGYAE